MNVLSLLVSPDYVKYVLVNSYQTSMLIKEAFHHQKLLNQHLQLTLEIPTGHEDSLASKEVL